mgnify:CR=1 FL=1
MKEAVREAREAVWKARQAEKEARQAMKRAEQELSEALAAAEEWRLRWEAGVKAARTAEAELQLAEQARDRAEI